MAIPLLLLMLIINQKEMIEEVFICECFSPEHQMIVRKDLEDGTVYVEIHLVKFGFFRRLWHGIKYIFGYKSQYGAWDEFIFKPEDLEKLKDFLNKK